MIFLDTGYVVAVLRPRDALHARALAWSRRLKEPLMTTELVLWEAVNHFSAPVDRPKIHKFISLVRSRPAYSIIPASSELLEAGLKMHRDYADKAWSLTDCISFHVMRERGVNRALAFDQHFEQAGFDAMLRRDPS